MTPTPRSTPAAWGFATVLSLGLVVASLGSSACHLRDAEAPAPEVPLGTPDLPAPIAPGSGLGVDDPPEPEGPDPYEEMIARYRPGPYVEVQGMLPSAQAEASLQSWLSRGGRTIDNPWLVYQGELRPDRAPSATPTVPDGPTLAPALGENWSEPLVVIPGVPVNVAVQIADPDGLGNVNTMVAAFENYLGHFRVPLMLDSEIVLPDDEDPGEGVMHFAIDAPIPPVGVTAIPGQPFDATLYLAVVDRAGNVSSYLTRPLRVMPVGTGDVEVTMTMSVATDLDLYVVDPAGITIYYGNTSSMTGGRLDLDANAACSSNYGVNNEHIYWAEGQAPAGTYTVRVAHFEACRGVNHVDYSVTINNCGETVILEGSFDGRGDTRTCTSPPGAQQQWCQEVVAFEVSPCAAAAAQ